MRRKEIEVIKKEVRILNTPNHPQRELILKKWKIDMDGINKVCKERIEAIRKEKIKNAGNRKAYLF